MGRAEEAARTWAAEQRLLAGLEGMTTRPANGPTAPDLHDLHAVKDALLADPFDRDTFAEELAGFLALAGVSPEELAEAAKAVESEA